MKRFIKPLYPLLIILVAIFLLRLPSLLEPYWYGDEGIYLAIGQALQRGSVLYRDIWDNKPPLLYLIYAISPTLLWAKISATIFVLGTITFVYKITKYITKEDCFALLAMTLTGVLLSLPIFEGTIANAELYFTLPITIGAYIVIARSVTTKQSTLLGILFTVAFLIKVPAVFDFLGLFLAYFLIKKDFKPFFIVGIVFVTIIVPIFFYFYLNNGLGDFITAAFKQNSSYIAIDSGPLSKLSNPLFVKAFLLLLTLLTSSVLFVKKRLSKELLFLIFWFSFSLYGALLSNRPYPHYLLQIVPPVTLLVFYLIGNFKKYFLGIIILIIVLFQLGTLFGKQLYFVQGLFSNGQVPYYSNFFDYISERKSWTEYVNYFDGRTSNNYAIANYLATRAQSSDTIFVWGDNAFVYVLSNLQPATKFIQAHHLSTIDQRNYIEVMQKLEKRPPKFIIVSRPVHFAFPKLEEFIKKDYSPADIFLDLNVYQLAK